ncbi:sigma 54-interacting transcriptional regulator [Lederbergia sp. NSJ-179]|uniref:sigma-54 interaction domain-containing protein n=1 Tax=Lederbergia sp. NSJ-179 TaxID=2931402 RepID=UPI001FD0D617|nr:sigma 54-interacting transcriptional regulator [Lederbergia sp. NSJ-179]MCJ7842383.1 sigma 54-interacting transcriptional regulator [Lederbergia sp. NSJ-179]
MFLLQKEIMDFISTNMTVLEEGHKNIEQLVYEKTTAHPDTEIFLRKQNSVYVLKYNKDRQLISQKCKTIASSADIQELINLFGDYKQHEDSQVIVVKLNHTIIGFIHIKSFLSTLFYKYQKLDVFFQTVLNTIDTSCTVIDHEKKVLVWTKGAEKIFSIKKEEILGKTITNFFHPDDLEIITTLEQGTSVNFKQHHARDNLIVLINSNPVRLNGQTIGAVVSETDITSQVRMNRELFTISEKMIELEKEMKAHSKMDNPFIHIKGNSHPLKETISKTKKAASTPANILILGESGVGKELFAKAVHDLREQKNAPFVPINCGAIPSALFESELFGYEKGAFSGADHKGKKGKIELAKNGTLFLDEIGEMPMEMQVKLLRVLQEKRYFPVGGTKEIEVDFRVVAATNRDLLKRIKEGSFREDLYYRLNVVSLEIPPLRKRIEDVIELTHYFLYELSVKYHRPVHGISQEVMQALLQYQWPGNIRELRNVIERLVVFSENGELNITDLPFYNENISGSEKNKANEHLALSQRLQRYEKEIIISELEKTKGNKLLCAKNLHISRATLYNRMNKLGIHE